MHPVVAIIPARGGSKRLPRKNVMPIGGLPLVAHSVRHAVEAECVDEVYVSTDDPEIAAVARRYGGEVIERPAELADDTATSESALVHALAWRAERGLPEPELVVFLQGTSPVRRRDDIDRAVAHLRATGADSLLSACENSRFIWAERADGEPYPLNYDYKRRKREQDLERQWRENGSIYLFKPWVLREENNRLGGKKAVFEMDYWSSFQIDTPEHAELCDWILRRPEFAPAPEFPHPLDLVVFDFDGVMTDDLVHVTEDGTEQVSCSRSDGMGVGLLRAAGVRMLVLSKEVNPVVAARCAKLRLPCLQGIDDKAPALAAYLAEHGLAAERTVYVGNDVNDLPCMRMVGLPVVPADAHPTAAAAARLTLTRPGGRGAVRELADAILHQLQLHAS